MDVMLFYWLVVLLNGWWFNKLNSLDSLSLNYNQNFFFFFFFVIKESFYFEAFLLYKLVKMSNAAKKVFSLLLLR
jgi:hypothetical protein